MFNELYYWMYYHLCKIKTNDTPALNAYIIISVLQGFNIGTIYIIAAYFLKVDTSTDRNTALYMGLSLIAVLYLINYFLLYRKRETIFQKYESASPKRKTKGMIYFWLYVVLSLVILFTLGINLVPTK